MRGRKKKEQKVQAMNFSEIFAALAMLEEERGIPQSFMMEKIVQALTTAYKKDHPGVENVVVDVDAAHHNLQMFVQKTVVSDDTLTADEIREELNRRVDEDPDQVIDWEGAPKKGFNPSCQIKLAAARAISPRYEIGDLVNLPVDHVEFHRIAAGNGKQVIIQGLREAERGMVYEEFNSKQNEILTGTVTRVDPRNGNVSLRIGTGTESTEALLLFGEQVEGEVLSEGMHVKVYVVEVRRNNRGPQVLISRTHPGLVKRLFELEVPEIYDGTVEVRSTAREAGSRTKMAVWSNDDNVDPIGACVGPKGQRVAAIVDELRGEKIDIIKYDEDPATFIAAALSPADVIDVWMADEAKACRVIVPDDQLSLAIGKEGQNARLAARLTGYKIDIKPESYQETEDEYSEETAPVVPAEEAAPVEEVVPAEETVPVDEVIPATPAGEAESVETTTEAPAETAAPAVPAEDAEEVEEATEVPNESEN